MDSLVILRILHSTWGRLYTESYIATDRTLCYSMSRSGDLTQLLHFAQPYQLPFPGCLSFNPPICCCFSACSGICTGYFPILRNLITSSSTTIRDLVGNCPSRSIICSCPFPHDWVLRATFSMLSVSVVVTGEVSAAFWKVKAKFLYSTTCPKSLYRLPQVSFRQNENRNSRFFSTYQYRTVGT